MRRKLLLTFIVLCTNLSALQPVIILLGPPGCGKGNLSDYLKEHYCYGHLGAGDLVRQEIERDTDVGKEIAAVVRSGKYIDLEIMHSLMEKAISKFAATSKPFVIDGYGGNDPHMAQFLYKQLQQHALLDKTIVIFLDAKDEVCKSRMSSRLICKSCSKIYNSLSMASNKPGECDHCRGELVSRSHETAEIIDKRLALYRNSAEAYFMKSADLFPSIFLRTDADLYSCLEFYKALFSHLEAFEGDVENFVKQQTRIAIENSSLIPLTSYKQGNHDALK